MTPQTPNLPANAKPRVSLVILKHLGCYILGILACVILTPVEFVLVGAPLWLFYPVLAVIGFFVYFILSSKYTFGSDLVHWGVGLLGLIAVVLGIATHFRPLRRLRVLRPLLISFSIGFVGTLGVYYGAAQNI